MSSKILYIIFLFFSYSGQGQISIQNLSLTKPDSNILYIGIDNKIKLSGLPNLNSVKIISSGSSVSPTNGFFEIKVSTPGKSVIKAYKSGRQIAAKTFIISKIPEPQTGIGNFHDTTLSFQTISAIKILTVYLPNCILNYKMPVISFDLEAIHSDGSKKMLSKGNGNTLSPDQLVQIGNLKAGDKLNFDNIRIVGPDDTFVPSFYIILK